MTRVDGDWELDRPPELSAEGYGLEAKGLIQSGRSLRAFELCREGLDRHPNDPLLEFYEALALARGGNPARAGHILAGLLKRADLPIALRVEALSLGGRLAKDLLRSEKFRSGRQKHARAAAQRYREAYELSRDLFPGVNAASMLMVSGRTAEAHQIAGEIVQQGESQAVSAAETGDYWLFASLGEASLVLGNQTKARDWYRQALDLARDHLGDLASMRRNLLLLRQYTNIPAELLQQVDVGSVIAFSGHMIDHPTRTEHGLAARFPPSLELEREVAAAISAELERVNAVAGFASAACGSDIIFAEQMLARGAELHLMLPFDVHDFYRTSVDFDFPHMARWRERHDRVLSAATEVHYATRERFLGDELLFDFANALIQGLTLLRASELEAEPTALVVAEGKTGRSTARAVGGTVAFLRSWRAGGRSASVIDLAPLRARTSVAPSSSPTGAAPATSGSVARRGRKVKAMLFADVKNFSKLDEEQAPAFFEWFLNGVARLIQRSKEKPVFQNTWGDGLFLVFDRVVPCAQFAWGLLRLVEGLNWNRWGLPQDTAVRVGLHAGPVYPRLDRVIGRRNYFGSHVNRAARIEPVTTPGCAFATEQFAALLAVEGNHAFRCEYVGMEDLAKGFDRCQLYCLEQRETKR